MVGKFGQQLSGQVTAQQSRTTRTQRVILAQENLNKKREYEALQLEAQRLQTTEFSNVSLEQYTQKYNNLKPELRQFFLSPQEIQAQRQKSIDEQKAIFQQRINTKLEILQDVKRQRAMQHSAKEDEYLIKRLIELEDSIEYARNQMGQLDQGATAQDIFQYANLRAKNEVEAREMSINREKQFRTQVQSGTLDVTLSNLGLNKNDVTLKQYTTVTENYNETIQLAQKQEIKAWQEANPTEKLQFDSSGNVISVKSNQFGGKIFTLADYQKKVEDYNNQIKKYNAELEVERINQEKKTEEAKKVLNDIEFGKDISLEQPKQNIFQKTWSGAKALYLSSPFGIDMPLSESQQAIATELRFQNTKKLTQPDITWAFGIPAYNFNTIPLNKSWELVQTQEKLDYEQKQSSDMVEQLTKTAESSSTELKPYIEQEGLKVLETKGVSMTTQKTFDFNNPKYDAFGNLETQTTTTITDPSFERRLSQSMYNLEVSSEKFTGTNKKIYQGLVYARAGLTEALKTYATFGAIGLVGKGISTGYKLSGLPTIQLYRNVQLAEGFARVPRTFATTKAIAGLGLTGLYTYGKVQQYKSYTETSKYGKPLFFVETAGELAGMEMATHSVQKTVNKITNNIRNRKIIIREQADLSQEGFLRKNPKLSSGKERVYMERYSGFKLRQPKTWLQSLKGYEKGQFTGRIYKQVPDEVIAQYQYGGDVFIYNKAGKLSKIIKAEPFPYDTQSTHLNWFKQKNIQEYGIGKYSDLPIDVKSKAFGYSATGEQWAGSSFEPNVIYYDQSRKALHTSGAIQYVSGKGVSAGFLRIFQRGAEESSIGKRASKPIIYSNYFDDVYINKAVREVKGIDITGRELKAYKYTNPVKPNTLNIPLMKREVEGTVDITEIIPIRKKFGVKLAGWKVPYQENIFGKPSDFSMKEIKAITKSFGSFKEIKSPLYSSLPSSKPISYTFYSPTSSSKKSMSKSYTYSSPKSSTLKSAISSLISYPKSQPRSSGGSSGGSSSITSIISSPISSPPYSSPPYKPRRIKYPTVNWGSSDLLKKQIRKKGKKTPQFNALFPDFTSRALGLQPKRVGNVKQALREINRLQTGFEVRRGARLKNYSPIDEKSLMKGIMK